MTCLYSADKSTVICGNFAKAKCYKNGKPKGWHKREYKAIIHYPEHWTRITRGKKDKCTCTCKEIIECFHPYYGFTWIHEDSCALMQHPRYKEYRIIRQSE